MRRLLLVEPGGRVVLHDADSGARALVSGEAAGGSTIALTAAWSPAGRWAAASVAAGEGDDIGEIRVAGADGDGTRTLVTGLAAFCISPSPDGRLLAHLSAGPLGLELGLSDMVGDEPLRIIERGQPLYWAWKPDSTALVVHVADRVMTIEVNGRAPEVLDSDAGQFLAPAWTADGQVVFASRDAIVSRGPDGEVTSLAEHSGPARFAVDPEGRRVAQVVPDGDGVRLAVIDLLTREQTTVTSEPTAAFFWSGEGRRLAALVAAGPSEVQWIVWDGLGLVRLDPFRPGPDWLREVLPFFEQYARSHAIWSSDETSLVAPALDHAGSVRALVQSVDPAIQPAPVASARLAWWVEDADQPAG